MMKIIQAILARVKGLSGQGKYTLPDAKPADGASPPVKDTKGKRRLIVTLLVAAVVLVVFAKTIGNIQKALFKKAEAKKAPSVTFEEGLSPVKVLKVKKIDFKDTLPVMGNIKGFREIDLKFQVAGVIESINFEEGEKVQEGDIIASLVQKEALLKLKYSGLENEKNKKLFEIGALTQLKLDQSKLEYESAKSELDKTNIYAPSNGLLGARRVDVGSYATPTDTVGTFIDIEKVYAEFNVIEKDIPKIALRQKVDVFIDAYPTKTFSGQVDRIVPIIEGRSRAQNIKIELANKEGVLKPGMFTRALVYTYEKKDALVIPSSGLKKKETEYLVYVVHKEEANASKEEAKKDEVKKTEKKASGLLGAIAGLQKKKEVKTEKEETPKEKPVEIGTVEVRKLKPGYMTQDLVEVEEGVKEDELIIVEVQEEFKDKAKVEIMETQESVL